MHAMASFAGEAARKAAAGHRLHVNNTKYKSFFYSVLWQPIVYLISFGYRMGCHTDSILEKGEEKMQMVIATIWVKGPVFILRDGTVMEPNYTATGSCWSLDWVQSSELTATVISGTSGVGGELGYDITVFKNGEVYSSFSTAS